MTPQTVAGRSVVAVLAALRSVGDDVLAQINEAIVRAELEAVVEAEARVRRHALRQLRLVRRQAQHAGECNEHS